MSSSFHKISPNRPILCMLCLVSQRYKDKRFFCGHNFLTEDAFAALWMRKTQFGQITKSKFGQITKSKFGQITKSQFGQITKSQFGKITKSKFGHITKSYKL